MSYYTHKELLWDSSKRNCSHSQHEMISYRVEENGEIGFLRQKGQLDRTERKIVQLSNH